MYPFSHSGPVLVCGSGYSLLDDLDRARILYPDAPCIAVKGASSFVHAFAIFGLHPGKLPAMREAQAKLHSEFTVHTGGGIKDYTKLGKLKPTDYDYHWPNAIGGCSGWAAVKMAHFMGFNRVIMCGIPLSKGGYFNGKFSKPFQRDDVLEFYRSHVRKDAEYHSTTTSMSGWTKEFLDHSLPDKEP